MKIIKLSIIPIILLLNILTMNSYAQQDIENLLGVSFGGSDFHIKDERASPLIFSSIGIAPTLQFIHIGKSSRHYFEASYFSNDLRTYVDNFKTYNDRARIRYSYVHYITGFNIFRKNIKLFLGGSAVSYLCNSDYYYLWTQSTYARSMESWYWSNSIDVSAQLEYNNSRGEFLSAQFFIPVISNLSRPQFSTTADYNYTDNDWKFKMFGETEFLTENFSINTLLTYKRPLIWNFNIQLTYEFYYTFYGKPDPMSMYMNNVRAGLLYSF